MERRDNSDDENDQESSDGRPPSQSNSDGRPPSQSNRDGRPPSQSNRSPDDSRSLTVTLQNLRAGQLRSPHPPPSSPLLQQRNPVLHSLSSPQSQSSSQEQSQQPGPSGLHLHDIVGASGGSGSVGGDASLQASAGAMPSLRGQVSAGK